MNFSGFFFPPATSNLRQHSFHFLPRLTNQACVRQKRHSLQLISAQFDLLLCVYPQSQKAKPVVLICQKRRPSGIVNVQTQRSTVSVVSIESALWRVAICFTCNGNTRRRYICHHTSMTFGSHISCGILFLLFLFHAVKFCQCVTLWLTLKLLT